MVCKLNARAARRSAWRGSRFSTLCIVSALALSVAASGCGESGPAMGRVSGKITYADGSAPQGGVAVIRFEPAEGTTAEIRKAASNQIETDGSYDLFTVRPGDGVIHGKYKAVFTILESYRTGKSLVDKKYTSAATTPFECVVDSASHTFDFELEKSGAN